MKLLKNNPSIKACIFDLDGTLLDSMLLWQEVDCKYLKRYGIEFDPSFSEEIKKMTFDESALYFIEKFHIPRTIEEIKQDWNEMIEIEYRDNIECKEGVYELLEYFKRNNIKMCIATSCNKKHALMALQRLEILEYFEFIMTCNDVGKNKEHPDIFLTCANQLGYKPEECFIVEDLHLAIKVAKKEGFKTIGVYDHLSAFEKKHIENLCDYYIYSFLELIV